MFNKLKALSKLKRNSLIAILLLIGALVGFNLMTTVNVSINYDILILAAITLLFTIFNFELKGYKMWIKNLVILIIIATFTFLLFEIFDEAELVSLQYNFHWMKVNPDFKMRIFINILLCMVPFFVFFMFTASARFSLVAGIVLQYFIGLAFYLVMSVRGEMVLFTDLYALGTAMEVASNYDFSITPTIVSGTLFAGFLIVLAAQAEHMSVDKWARRRQRFITAATLCIAITAFLNVDVEKYYYSWNVNVDGHPYVFAVNAKLTRNTPPADYDADEIATIIPEISDTTAMATVKPNIIVVMNESLADYTTLGDLQTNIDYMPNIRSLTENTISGQAYVSVFGGGTCDSEYAFLTGNTISFLADNARPYQLYVNDTSPSLVSTLNDLDYSSHAIHPGEATAWNRDEVYPDFGFEDFTTRVDMPDATYTRSAYVSDHSGYQYLIQKFEENQNSGSEKPFFGFNVTIQNHGGYDLDASDLEAVEITNLQGDYPLAEQYMTLVHDSDAAFGELIAYFETVEEPTMILMFGDHFPNVEPALVEELMGKSTAEYTLEDKEKLQNTPFVIWANYDIQEQQNVQISLNYLSSLLLEQAQLPQTAYNKYLLNLSQEMPVLNKDGVITNTGAYYRIDDPANPYYNDLENYQDILYNNIFDNANRYNSAFYLQGDINENAF